MRKLLYILTALALVMTATVADATDIIDDRYSDVPIVMTQDSVISVEVSEGKAVEVLQPDMESFTLLNDVYRFVYKDKNRPARYYDLPTQEEISELCGGIDIDILYMTEAMRLQLVDLQEKPVDSTEEAADSEDTVSVDKIKPVIVDMTLDAEYDPGQLVVVVLGIPGKDLNYTWYPYRAEVPETGLIRWKIPVAEWEELAKQNISFHVLTVRSGPDGEMLWGEDSYPDSDKIFSKDAEDLYVTRRWYAESGKRIDDDFRLFLTHMSIAQEMEVYRIGDHIAQGGLILDYFPVERKEEALLMLPDDITENDLAIYDIIALMDENYKDTYGDVSVEIQFGTTYDTEKAMVVLAGFEIEDAREQPYMDWYVLRAEAIQTTPNQNLTDMVRIGLKQLNLPWMEEEPMMLVMISQKLEYNE